MSSGGGVLVESVAFHVEGQVITAGELALAQVALEGLGSGVLPVVTRQLVGPGKLPPATLPSAHVGLLTRVKTHVEFQSQSAGQSAKIVQNSTIILGASEKLIISNLRCGTCSCGDYILETR